jgi:hypothetical protein
MKPMLPRWCLTTLVFALPLLAISLGVVLAAAELMRALGDEAGAYGLRWVALVVGLFAVVDAVCLVVVLGLSALENDGE